jgi:ubiquitin-activating enzyme E1
LKESIQRPKFLLSDFSKADRPQQLHLAMQALHRFWEQQRTLPEPWNKDHATQMVQLAHEINSTATQKVLFLSKLWSQFSVQFKCLIGDDFDIG